MKEKILFTLLYFEKMQVVPQQNFLSIPYNALKEESPL